MMAYPNISAMKDALGDIVLFEQYDRLTNKRFFFTFDMLPQAAQLALFAWINNPT
jgi:dihydrodipicolinate synthase/N-acetylneuraminate lyase